MTRGQIRRPERQRKEYRTWQWCETVTLRPCFISARKVKKEILVAIVKG